MMSVYISVVATGTGTSGERKGCFLGGLVVLVDAKKVPRVRLLSSTYSGGRRSRREYVNEPSYAEGGAFFPSASHRPDAGPLRVLGPSHPMEYTGNDFFFSFPNRPPRTALSDRGETSGKCPGEGLAETTSTSWSAAGVEE